ncbi:MAG: hypothetical protein QXO15_03365 [Nitrososphaerota archaeon]
MGIEVLIERIKTLIKRTQESYDILEDAGNLREQFEKCLTGIARENMRNEYAYIDRMVFNAGANTQLIITSDCGVSIHIAEFPIPQDLRPPIVYYRENLIRNLLGLKEFIDNIDNVIREIDRKIAEIDGKNMKLRRMLEEIKDVLAPMIIAHELKG